MTGKRIGYVRVSMPSQNPDRQLEGIQLDKRFVDMASAKTINRPQLQLLLDYVREDDVVIIHSMDRLARNVKDLKHIVDLLVKQGINVHFVKEGLTFDGGNNPMSNLMLHLMGSFAEFEHAFILDRQREGIEIAKKAGKYKGTKRKLDWHNMELLKLELKNTEMTKAAIARKFNISRCTLYQYIRSMKNNLIQNQA